MYSDNEKVPVWGRKSVAIQSHRMCTACSCQLRHSPIIRIFFGSTDPLLELLLTEPLSTLSRQFANRDTQTCRSRVM
jgi:hypothetical protein